MEGPQAMPDKIPVLRVDEDIIPSSSSTFTIFGKEVQRMHVYIAVAVLVVVVGVLVWRRMQKKKEPEEPKGVQEGGFEGTEEFEDDEYEYESEEDLQTVE